jgi:hypothetical protein
MATRWRRRLAERSLARRNKFIPRQRTWFLRFKENLIPTRCGQVVSGLFSTFWRPHLQRSPLTRALCGSALGASPDPISTLASSDDSNLQSRRLCQGRTAIRITGEGAPRTLSGRPGMAQEPVSRTCVLPSGLASDRNAVPDEVIAAWLSSCRAWRNFVSPCRPHDITITRDASERAYQRPSLGVAISLSLRRPQPRRPKSKR